MISSALACFSDPLGCVIDNIAWSAILFAGVVGAVLAYFTMGWRGLVAFAALLGVLVGFKAARRIYTPSKEGGNVFDQLFPKASKRPSTTKKPAKKRDWTSDDPWGHDF